MNNVISVLAKSEQFYIFHITMGRLNTWTALTIFLFTIFGCGESSSEKYERRQREVRQEFENNTSSEQKKLIKDFFEGKIRFGQTFDGISGGFYCLWKQRDVDIYPHTAVNDLLKDEKFNITNKADSLDFIVISETVSHVVGTYSNGGDAVQLETLISVIDLKKETAYKLESFMGGMPPSTISRRRGGKSGAVGSIFGDQEITNFIKQKVKSQ